jgi:hypothetical protein
MARFRWYHDGYRHPRTAQEIRANQKKNSPYVRGKRKNLPTAWDDISIKKQKSWKYLGRKHQYREEKNNYNWREYEYDWRDVESVLVSRNIIFHMEKLGCYWERIRSKIRWYGPEY